MSKDLILNYYKIIHQKDILGKILLNKFIFIIFISSNLTIHHLFADALSPSNVLNLKSVTEVKISPEGEWIAYIVNVPRNINDKPGSSYSELYLISVKDGKIISFVKDKVHVSKIQWSPKGEYLAFIMKNQEVKREQIWLMSIHKRELEQITDVETGVLDYRWQPSGKKIAFIALTPDTDKEKVLKEKGIDFIYYEEDWKHRNLYMLQFKKDLKPGEIIQLTKNVTVWSFEFSNDGTKIAAAISEKNLIDYKYMFQKIHLIDLNNNKLTKLSNNSGKLGNFQFSPDDKKLAYTAALNQNVHAVSQVLIIPIQNEKETNLTIPDFKGHVTWVNWKDNNHLVYYSKEGVWTTLRQVNVTEKKTNLIINSKDYGFIFKTPSYSKDLKSFACLANSSNHPDEVFLWSEEKKFKRLTDLNPKLHKIEFGQQKVIQYKTRDGHEVEGLLILPLNYQEGKRYPSIVIVHGGPESNYSNGWLTTYYRPGQVLAGKGYVVFYPNYRASTGYGLEYAMKWHYGNPAGVEFDDIADGIDFLVKTGVADEERVGLGGGSYGGYAAAWFATYYTHYVKAVCMFVGISDLISKRSTTDIPYEELYVHSGKKLEEMWELSLKRSPIYYAHQSKTAVLIYGGTNDTRVSPSQSLEMYRRLKMNNHPAVRLVQYPGEKHGNRKQSGRTDVIYRMLDWYDWYVRDAKPLDGPMPPLDISDKYELDFIE